MNPASGEGRSELSQLAGLISGLVLTVSSSLPVALTGSMVVHIRDELDIGIGAYGWVILTYFCTGSLFSILGGRLTQSGPPVWGSALTIVCSVIAFMLAAIAATPYHLATGLAFAGFSKAIAHPTANTLILRSATPGQVGALFGIKQASIPIALVLAGLAVPTIVAMWGWRWTYVVAGVCVAVFGGVAIGVVSRHPTPMAVSDRAETVAGSVRIRAVAVGGGLAALAASPLSGFLVDWGVAAGLKPASAGTLLAVASAGGVTSRIVAGVFADRSRRMEPMAIVRWQLAFGAVSLALIGTGLHPMIVVGAVVAYSTTWGWPGLFHLGVVLGSRSPALSTGRAQVWASLGAGVGPVIFGLVVEEISYGVAWATFGIASLLAVIALHIGKVPSHREDHLI